MVLAAVLVAASPAAEAAACERGPEARTAMVAAAHPAAAAAGCAVLENGGGAVDAAVMVQAVLAVVEPQSSGLAGGTLITEYDRSARRVLTYEGLARAPALVTDGLRTPTAEERAALGVNEFESEIVATGRAVGLPGTLRALELAHRRSGRLPWRRLFRRAILLAARGFAVPPYLHDLMAERSQGIPRCRYPDLRARYCDGDVPKPVGARVVNAELASVLRRVRDGGADAFYEGPIASAIVERATAGPFKLRTDAAGPAVIPSLMTVSDLARYRAVPRPPVCRRILTRRICVTPPPSFGGVTVLQELALMKRGRVGQMPPLSADRVHLAIEASRLAQYDRREYVGDPDFDPVPVRGLLAGGYLDTRFGLFSPMRAIHPVIPGTPPGSASDGAADMTSHVSIVDQRGDAVSMTTTVNGAFGAHMEASGMILNNAQENFTRLDSISPGARVNAMAPDKRPRTAMGPAIAFGPRGRLRLVLGAAGGSAIPDYIAQTFLGITLDGMDPATAVAQGHWSGQEIASNCGGAVDAVSQLEAGTAAAALLGELRARSHPCPEVGELRSGLAAIAVGRVGLTGAADPRRDGAAVGF